jgi:hypothetical protein
MIVEIDIAFLLGKLGDHQGGSVSIPQLNEYISHALNRAANEKSEEEKA